MKYASLLNVATEWPVLPEKPRFKALPGRMAVLMCNPPEKSGEIVLPDSLSGNLRPDAGVVSAVGDCVPLSVGDRVYVRPYIGLHISFEEGVYRLLGREVFDGETIASVVDISEHAVAVERDGEVIPTPGNLLVTILPDESPVLRIHERKEKAVIEMVGEGSELIPGWIVPISNSANMLQIGDKWILPEADIKAVQEVAA